MNRVQDQESDVGPATSGSSLRRVITLPWLILYGVGSTVGAGIYVLTGAVAGRVGLLAPLAFLIASLLALCTALSFAELSARFPRAGGALIYVREGFGWTWLSTLVGLLTSAAGIVSAATLTVGFVGYLSALISIPALLAVAIVTAVVGGIAAWGVRQSVIAASLVTIVEVGGLVAIISLGLDFLAESPPRVPELVPGFLGIPGWSALVGSAVLCFYAFLGFEDIVNVAEEVRDARNAMPRAILWSLGLSTLLYVAVTAIAVLVVTPRELAESAAPLALVFERSGGSTKILASIALVAMLNGALIQIIMASRVLFSLARSGQLPSRLGSIHPRTQTPVFATFCVIAVVGLLAGVFDVDALAAATASISLFVFSLVNFSLVVLLHREQIEDAWLPIWVPAVGGVVSLLFLSIELAERTRSLAG